MSTGNAERSCELGRENFSGFSKCMTSVYRALTSGRRSDRQATHGGGTTTRQGGRSTTSWRQDDGGRASTTQKSTGQTKGSRVERRRTMDYWWPNFAGGCGGNSDVRPGLIGLDSSPRWPKPTRDRGSRTQHCRDLRRNAYDFGRLGQRTLRMQGMLTLGTN